MKPLVPFSTFAKGAGLTAARVNRYNAFPRCKFRGPLRGSPRRAIAELERLVDAVAPRVQSAVDGVCRWKNKKRQSAPLLYGLSLAAIFLALAALYETLSSPLRDARDADWYSLDVWGAYLGGFENGSSFRWALTVVGLTAKRDPDLSSLPAGQTPRTAEHFYAAIDAARHGSARYNTSMAFSLGVCAGS